MKERMKVNSRYGLTVLCFVIGILMQVQGARAQTSSLVQIGQNGKLDYTLYSNTGE